MYHDVDWKKGMKGKGKIPYSWLSKERMSHRVLPPLEEWIDDLYGEGTNQGDLNRYNQLFNDFHCKNVEEYCDLYLTNDNCILMDIVFHFNKFSLEKLHLDIGKFVTLPNLAWNAWLLTFIQILSSTQ